MQYQYAGWPDHGAPASTLPVRTIIYRTAQARAQAGGAAGPVVVHCSAGIGRTGAFCTIQTHVERMQQLKAAGVPRAWLAAFAVDVFWTVVQLRWCRFGMVQQIDQYAFCYTAILDEARALGLIRLSSNSLSLYCFLASTFFTLWCLCASSGCVRQRLSRQGRGADHTVYKRTKSTPAAAAAAATMTCRPPRVWSASSSRIRLRPTSFQEKK